MKLTNRERLPLPIAAAVYHDDYDPGNSDFTVTGLLKPPQQAHLQRLHDEEVEEDVSERIWSLLGQVIHSILERGDLESLSPEVLAALGGGSQSDFMTEQRFYAEFAGAWVGGKFDLYFHDEEHGWVLQDYKFVSIWEVIRGPKPERHQQLNMLAEIMRRNGFQVDRLETVAILRDWAKSAAKRAVLKGEADSYPQQHVVKFFIPMWTPDEVTRFTEERVRLHQAALAGEPEPCTDEDRWYRGTKWAVRKTKNKRADKGGVHDTYEDAFAFAERQGYVSTAVGFDGLETKALNEKVAVIEERVGTYVRCEDYCSVADFCTQWRESQPEDGDVLED